MATEREKRLAATLGKDTVELSNKPLKPRKLVVEIDEDGNQRPHYSTKGELNKRDYGELQTNAALLVVSDTAVNAIDTAAEQLQYTLGDVDVSQGTMAFVQTGLKLAMFSGLKLISLWVSSGGLTYVSAFIPKPLWLLRIMSVFKKG